MAMNMNMGSMGMPMNMNMGGHGFHQMPMQQQQQQPLLIPSSSGMQYLPGMPYIQSPMERAGGAPTGYLAR